MKFGHTFIVLINTLLCAIALHPSLCIADDEFSKETLWEAAQQGQLELVKKCLEAKIDPDVPTQYGATALFYACDRGHKDIVDVLLKAGARADRKDRFYNATPVTWAMSKKHYDIVQMLVESGTSDADSILSMAVQQRNVDLAKSIYGSGKVSEKGIAAARKLAATTRSKKLMDAVEAKDQPEKENKENIKLSDKQLKVFAGNYSGPRGFDVKVSFENHQLVVEVNSNKIPFRTTGLNTFEFQAIQLEFEKAEVASPAFTWSQAGNKLEFKRSKNKSTSDTAAKDEDKAEFKVSSVESLRADRAISSKNWPNFRGNGARGIAEGQAPPVSWDIQANPDQLKWKTAIPGLAHSCPVIWENDLYVTSAISSDADNNLKIGNYGDVDSVEDDSLHRFVLYCLDKQTGKIKWERVANEAVPKVKRHLKSTHANSTPATNGKYVVAFFGSEGLYCYRNDGTLVWKKDLGKLDSGWFYDAGYQWGFASSPIIFEDRVIVQCDIQKDSFLACFDLSTGNEIWREARDEIPSWSTPTVIPSKHGPIVVTNATKYARANRLSDGKEIWRLDSHSEIVVPTPFIAHGMIFIASGYSPIQPVYAISPDAEGDISLADNTLTNEHIKWSKKRGGPYMPCPIVYGDYLYTCANSGVLAVMDARTGKQVYRRRLRAPGGGLSFVGSPLAADGHIYFPAEDGRVLTVKAGPEFELVAVSQVGEYVLSTPAISDGVFFVRGQNHVAAFQKNAE